MGKRIQNLLYKEHLSENFETILLKILNDYLRLFYANLRKKDGTYNAPSSLIRFRASIHRHLMSPNVDANVNILNDETFKRANRVLQFFPGRLISREINVAKRQSFASVKFIVNL